MSKLLVNWESFEMTPESIKESRERNGGKILLKGILQKADTVNQNGRIYPKAILEREVRNYQKFIIENRALGECVPPGTEIFTSDGWKNIEDISDNEEISTLNLSSLKQESQRISRKVEMSFEGSLLHISIPGSLDMKLTPNHKMLLWDESGKAVSMLATEFASSYKNAKANLRNLTIKTSLNKKAISVANLKLSIQEIPYSGNVYCVTVPNSTWLMRSNGKVCWTHNCDHPESSVVNLKNASHVVRSAEIDGNVVKGTVELLNTPSGLILQSLVESGVKLGISSRGVGSTKKEGDYQVVQEDFQLICWDFVSEPSTPGAFMLAEGREISNDDLKKVFNRSDRIDRILNDIISSKSTGESK